MNESQKYFVTPFPRRDAESPEMTLRWIEFLPWSVIPGGGVLARRARTPRCHLSSWGGRGARYFHTPPLKHTLLHACSFLILDFVCFNLESWCAVLSLVSISSLVCADISFLSLFSSLYLFCLSPVSLLGKRADRQADRQTDSETGKQRERDSDRQACFLDLFFNVATQHCNYFGVSEDNFPAKKRRISPWTFSKEPTWFYMSFLNLRHFNCMTHPLQHAQK